MRLFVFRQLFVVLALLAVNGLMAQTGITGRVTDKKTKEPLIGATVVVDQTKQTVKTDIDGNFTLKNVAAGKYMLNVSYVSYSTQKVAVEVVRDKTTQINVELDDAALQLKSVEVVARRRTDTELSMLKTVRTSLQVVSGISSQQITKSLDRDASEVVKRVPGVTIMDNRFIVVRGLNQRYNNVWLNNAATPSSETDVKAFSFDAIPSNMIDNMMVYKTGAPELPGEATGGFVKIVTKNIPDENFMNVEVGLGYNDVTTFQNTYRLNGSAADYLGLGSSFRNLPSDFPTNLATVNSATVRDAAALKLGSDWIAGKHTAMPNLKLGLSFGRKWKLSNGNKLGTITSLNYSQDYNTRNAMKNFMYESFDAQSETPVYLYKYYADIYSREIRVGLMHNWAYEFANGDRIEFKNIVNQIGVDKTANTYGWNNYRQGNFKYFSNQYSGRTTYSGQLSGQHKFNEAKAAKLDWNTGFAYANRIEPNRQNWSMKENSDGVYEYQLPVVASINELGRLYLTNHEFVATAGTNYEQKLALGTKNPLLKAGAYFEFKTRNYKERSICYKATNSGMLTDSEINSLSFDQLFTDTYLGQGKVLVTDEQTDVANAYKAKNLLGAGYLGLNVPLGAFNVYGGVRAEYNRLMLDGFYNINSPVKADKPTMNLFPSVNASYNLTEKSLIRLAYAATINRPEFRELAPLVYYDFTERTTIRGNPALKNCLIQNIDVRFEHYPTPNETYSLALFYKNFRNPIEMVSIGSGSSFSFDNAEGANNYGVELEVKKSLETMIGLKNFSINLNASYIYSEVTFANQESNHNRPLQGQSPYVLNAGLYYQNDKAGLSSTLMYNVLGKRILVAAQVNQGQIVVPDFYGMPRHVIDFTLSKKLGKKTELKFGVKDLLAQPVKTQQTYEYEKNGVSKSITLDHRSYNPGRTFSLGLSVRL